MLNTVKKMNIIRNIGRARFDKASMNILWVESFVFAGIYGLMFRSWLVGGLLFLCLFMFIIGRKTAVYSIFILSFLWSFVFAAIGFGIAGVAGAGVLGLIVFMNAVRIHLRDLKSSWDNISFVGNTSAVVWRGNWCGGQHNNN